MYEVKVKFTQLCLTLCDPMDDIVHGIFQPRIMGWIAVPFSSWSSQSRDRTQVSHIAAGFFTSWATREYIHSVYQFSSVAQSCPTLCDPMNRSTPGLPVHHQLLEFTQAHVHRVGDAIQPSDPLSSPSPPAPNPSQHQGLFQWVNSLHQVAKVLSFSFSISPSNAQPGLIFRMDWLDLLLVQGISRVFFNTTVQKHQIFGAQLSSQSNSHIHIWPLEKP